MENRKHSNDSYIIYSQANRGGSGFRKVGQLVNGTKTPFSTQVFSFSSKGPFPGVFCGPAWAPQDKAFPPRLTEREQQGLLLGAAPTQNPLEAEPHSCTHLAPLPAGAPKDAPRLETSARGDARAASDPTPDPEQRGAERAVRADPGAAPGTA